MSLNTRGLAAILGAAALAVPSVAVAAPGKAKGGDDARTKVETRVETRSKANAKRVKLATYKVKGIYAGDGKVDVKGGNAHARRAGLFGEEVAFDFSQAKLVVADTNGDARITDADLKVGDKLVIQLKLPRTLGAGPHVARKVVDQTNPPAEDTQTATDGAGTTGGEGSTATGGESGSEQPAA